MQMMDWWLITKFSYIAGLLQDEEQVWMVLADFKQEFGEKFRSFPWTKQTSGEK